MKMEIESPDGRKLPESTTILMKMVLCKAVSKISEESATISMPMEPCRPVVWTWKERPTSSIRMGI